ncbi:hypothetical protein HDU96_001852 [Phlyctochytrium bullatum]|nr:hypothetical protein HDU96_001852 [Phlyctochytrium bullatum]
MPTYRDSDISRKSVVTASSYDNSSVRCSGDVCSPDKVKYDIYYESGPSHWMSQATLPNNGTCGEQWLQFDWTNDASANYQVEMLSILYGDLSFRFDGQTDLGQVTKFPTLTITPPRPIDAPENFTVNAISLNFGTDYTANSYSQGSNYTIFPNVTAQRRFDLFSTNSSTWAWNNVGKIRISWPYIVPNGFYPPQVCQMDVEKVFIAGRAVSPLKLNPDPTPSPTPKGSGVRETSSSTLSGGAIAAIIIVPTIILAPIGVLFFLRQRNIAKRRAAAALRTMRIG